VNLWAYAFDRSIPRRMAILRAYLVISLKIKLRRLGPGAIRVLDYRVRYADLSLFRMLFREIFIKRVYAFVCDARAPRIIDAGANIGLATVFFKSLYPDAEIVAFEPEPATFELLKQNVLENSLTSVTLVNAALGERDEPVAFYVRNDVAAGDIGASTRRGLRYVHHSPDQITSTTVRSVRLSSYLDQNRPIDFLKLDIEGSEGAVIGDIASKLVGIEAIAIEYHRDADRNPFNPIVSALSAAGHRHEVEGRDSDDTLFIRTKRV